MNFLGCDCSNCWQKRGVNKEDFTDQVKIALVGNPNVGKSVIFNALSGFYVEVSNYPGTTVDVSKAFTEFGEIIDTPGAYSLGNYTDDEIVTQNIVQNSDVVINIVSAMSLERDLFLTQQLIDMDFPIVLVVNQMDEARKKGIEIDCEKLQSLLGVKVIPTVAIHNNGISDIINTIKNKDFYISNNKIPYVRELFKDQDVSRCDKFSKILEIESQNSTNFEQKDIIYAERRKFITETINQITVLTEKKESFSDVIGNLLLSPIVGSIAAFGMLYLLFQVVGVFIAGEVVDFLESKIILEYLIPWIEDIIDGTVKNTQLNYILAGEFGLFTMTVQYILGVLLPLVIGFYMFMSVLEDSGYLPRLAVLTDRFLSKLGLNGRAVIPIILGVGCTTMAFLTTRILGSKKERTITTAILGLTIPCSAQLGIILGLLAAIGGFKPWLIYITTLFIVLTLIGTVLNKVLPGKSLDLLIDLPPIRFPLIKNIFSKTFHRTWHFLKETTPFFALGSVLISTLQLTGGLQAIQKFVEPVVSGLLLLPQEVANVFIMGLIRRDFGAAGLVKMSGLEDNVAILSDVQILVSLIVISLFVPCIASVIILFKERGSWEALAIWFGSFIIAGITGGILARVLPFIF